MLIHKKLFPVCVLPILMRYAAGFLFIAVLLLFFAPTCIAIIPVFSQIPEYETIKWLSTVIGFTVIQAVLSAFFADIIGLCAAFFCARRHFFGRKALLSLSAIPLSMPPVVIALSFILFFGKNGFFNQLLGIVFHGTVSIGTFLYSIGGVLLIHSFYNFPIAMRTITTVWERLPERTEQAAVLLGASPFRIFRTIIFPALLPAFCASFLIIFLYSFFSFVIILLLGGLGLSTLEVELYRAVRADMHAYRAAVIAAVETGIAGSAVFFYLRFRSMQPAGAAMQDLHRTQCKIGNGIERVFFLCTCGIIILFLVLPLCSLFLYSLRPVHAVSTAHSFIASFSLSAWKNIICSSAFWEAALQTVQIGAGTASIAVTAALFFGYCTYTKNLPFVSAVPFFPLAVSSLVLGAGWLQLQFRPSVFMLMFAQASLAWPFAWTQIETGLAKIPITVRNAALLCSASRSDAFFRVFLPLCMPAIASAFCSVFAISAGDASLPLLLHIPHFENLALMLFRFAGSYRFTESAAVAIVLALLTGGFFSINLFRNFRF